MLSGGLLDYGLAIVVALLRWGSVRVYLVVVDVMLSLLYSLPNLVGMSSSRLTNRFTKSTQSTQITRIGV